MRTVQRDRHAQHDPHVVFVKKDYVILLGKSAKSGMKRTEDAADIRTRKTAHVALRRGLVKEQSEGVGILNSTLLAMKAEKKRDTAILYAGIAAGYANAMHQHGLMSDDELEGVIEIINQAGKDAMHRIETARALI